MEQYKIRRIRKGTDDGVVDQGVRETKLTDSTRVVLDKDEGQRRKE